MHHTLEIKAVTFKHILKNVSLSCTTGEVVGLLGRNGSGKSTLLKTLFGTIKPAVADIWIDEKAWNAKTVYKDAIAYSPQDLILPKDITVRALIPLLFDEEEQLNKIFYAQGIHRMEKIKVGRLSLGEQKYLQFLLTAYLPQHFILLDEPFSMVDPAYKDIIKEKITELKKTKGFIVTDHYYQDIFDIAEKIICMSAGTTIAVSNKQDLVSLGYLPAISQ